MLVFEWVNARLRRWAQSKSGTYVVLVLVPFLARPSDFSDRAAHWAFGRMAAIPFAAVLPAADVWSRALRAFALFNTRHIDYGASNISEAIKLSQQTVTWTTLGAFASAFIWIHIIAFVRWLWHASMRAITNRVRKDGQRSSPAPWRFFVYHTTGWMLWAGAFLWILAIANTVYGNITGIVHGNLVLAYWSMALFVMERIWLWAAVASAVLAGLYLLMWSNGEMLAEIYRTDDWASRVRISGWLAAPLSTIFAEIVLRWMLGRVLQWSSSAALP